MLDIQYKKVLKFHSQHFLIYFYYKQIHSLHIILWFLINQVEIMGQAVRNTELVLCVWGWAGMQNSQRRNVCLRASVIRLCSVLEIV